MQFKTTAFGKINLHLDIKNQREDGYHLLFSIMQSIGVSDEIEINCFDTIDKIEKADRDGYSALKCSDTGSKLYINISCINQLEPYFIGEKKCLDESNYKNYFLDLPLDRSNTAFKAVELFFSSFEHAEWWIKVVITKRIPWGAGLGGGSADAAAVLKGLSVLFPDKVSSCQVKEMASKIGADVAFCLEGGTQVAEGIGEELYPIPAFPFLPVLVVKPLESISTPEAYRQFDEFIIEHGEANQRKEKLRKELISWLQAYISKHTIQKNETDQAIKEVGKIHKEKISSWKAVKRYCFNDFQNIACTQATILKKLELVLHQTDSIWSGMSGSGSAFFAIYEDEISLGKALEQVKSMFPQQVFLYRTHIEASGNREII